MFADRTRWNLAVNRLSKALASHRVSGKPLLDLTSSNPTQCGFQYDGQVILRALSATSSLIYEPNARGLEIARRAVASYYAGRGALVPIENIFLTTSTSEAYSFMIRTLCNPGDELLIPEPSYPLFSFLADIQDVKLRRYPLLYDHGWQIDVHALELAITSRTRGVIAVHPNNPTGQFCTPHEIDRLNEICVSREMAIIADEVFLDFVLEGPARASCVSNDVALTFTMSGVSKISGLPQMKVAWLVANGPDTLKQEALTRLEVIADTYLSMNTPVQLATPVLLEQRHNFEKQLMVRVRTNLGLLDRHLVGQKSCTRLRVEGGWYVVLCVPATQPDEDMAIELLSTKDVYVHPGYFYDFPTDGYVVLSLITPERDFAEGVNKLLSMF